MATISHVRGRVRSLVNAARAGAGLDPLRRNGELTRAAQAHAIDMAERHYLDHDTQGGATWSERIRQFGFGGGNIGENIAHGHDDAAAVVDGWLHSPRHRARILDPAYTEMGVGFAPEGPYWVLDLGGR